MLRICLFDDCMSLQSKIEPSKKLIKPTNKTQISESPKSQRYQSITNFLTISSLNHTSRLYTHDLWPIVKFCVYLSNGLRANQLYSCGPYEKIQNSSINFTKVTDKLQTHFVRFSIKNLQ